MIFTFWLCWALEALEKYVLVKWYYSSFESQNIEQIIRHSFCYSYIQTYKIDVKRQKKGSMY